MTEILPTPSVPSTSAQPTVAFSIPAAAAVASWSAAHPGDAMLIDAACSAPSIVKLRPLAEITAAEIDRRRRAELVQTVAGMPLYAVAAEFCQCPHDDLIVDLLDIKRGRPVLITRPRHDWDEFSSDTRGVGSVERQRPAWRPPRSKSHP